MDFIDALADADLREIGAGFLLGLASSGEVIAAASDAVADGDAGEAMLALASLYRDALRWDVARALDAALDEHGEPPLIPDSNELRILALRVACRRYLRGGVELRAFSSWTHREIGHGGPAVAEELVLLDDDLDLAIDGLGPIPYRADLHQQAVARIERFLRATQ